MKNGKSNMIDFIQTTSRMFFKSFTISLLILILDSTAIWALPFGILIALGTEAKALTRKQRSPETNGDSNDWMDLINSESGSGYWEILHDDDAQTVTLCHVPQENYSDKDIRITVSYEQFEDLLKFMKHIREYKSK